MNKEVRFRFRSAFASDVGGRVNNEDAFLIDEDLGLFIVADGIGGCDKGEVASWFASEHLAKIVKDALRPHASDDTMDEFLPSQGDPEDLLQYAVLSANHRLYGLNEAGPPADAKRKMGTTLVSLFFSGNKVFITHVGDSRAYRLAEGSIQLLTHDHSWVEERVREGLLTPEEARTHKKKNIITRSVGFKPEVEVDIDALTVYPRDRFLLCSDGLSNMLKENDILFLGKKTDLQAACNEMVELAKNRGGKDNITAILVEVVVIGKESDFREDTI